VIIITSPDEADIKSRLAFASGMLGIKTPRYTIKSLDKKDWQKEVERSFPPLDIGRFYVHGTHIKAPVPVGKIGITVNAGAAFGSGEHATTSGCLLALSHLATKRKFHNPLDMGCGSGILALAMARLWHCNVIGTDIDPVSVFTAQENAHINGLHNLSRFAAGDGYNLALVRYQAPFDIITANILARPLCKMAPKLAEALAPDGVAILSGLLASQERYVMAAHRAQGLTLRKRICRAGWNTLVISRAGH
jgi:ribosomal protein L11 methyltransferase